MLLPQDIVTIPVKLNYDTASSFWAPLAGIPVGQDGGTDIDYHEVIELMLHSGNRERLTRNSWNYSKHLWCLHSW